MQLLAIVSKQDNIVTEAERNYVINLLKQDLDPESLNKYLHEFDDLTNYFGQNPATNKEDPTRQLSVKETVQTLTICNKISKTLEQKQKIFLLIKILQLIAVDSNFFTPQKKKIIEAISAVFNISERELDVIKAFVFHRPDSPVDFEEILLVNNNEPDNQSGKPRHIQADINGEVIFLKLSSVEMYFVKYYGEDEITMNGLIMVPGQVYVFGNGSTIKSRLGAAIYYSDLIRYYIAEITSQPISLNVHGLEYYFGNGIRAIHDVNLSEGPGKLVGIMGVSGVGKTTLLNLLAGINKPTGGKILINGINLYSPADRRKLKGVIGYIAQDDLLIEELTVFENLYYSARLCFAGLSDQVLKNKVEEVLKNLGLWERRDLKVGSILDKKLSGGQRKRLNIALELIREPSILYVDEPTSGLSSRDSENIMDLLKELTYRGKLIIVVIHQPSSDIYKMFDRILILDTGGSLIYYGNPIEAVTYFKKATRQINSETGICKTCGNVNPEQIFNIVEERAVDEHGNFVEKRKITPKQWEDLFKKSILISRIRDEKQLPGITLDIPSRLKQSIIFLKRDFLKKISDRQYLLINLLESPVLALILSIIVRYNNYDNNSAYRFRFNDNFPVFIMMSIIVALFFGLMVSAEEIIGDRKILKRESFLNLSWNSYLFSKLGILFSISAIQTLTFVMISNAILEIRGMFLPFWLILFSVSCLGNLLGLNISSAFKTSVTVYILIPLLIIPQMLLSGLLVSFDKMNSLIGDKSRVPLIADMMTTRWAYEALAVYQFTQNRYEKPIYPVESEEYESGFRSTFFIDKLREITGETEKQARELSGQITDLQKRTLQRKIDYNLGILSSEIASDPFAAEIDPGITALITLQNFVTGNTDALYNFLDQLKKVYLDHSNSAGYRKEKMLDALNNRYVKKGTNLNEVKNLYYNNNLADLVRNSGSLEKITVYKGHIVQLADPIFNDHLRPAGFLDYRTHFFSPVKPFMNTEFPTFWFNLAVIWVHAAFLYFLLYFEILRKMMIFIRRFRISHRN